MYSMNRTALFAVLACGGCVIAEPELGSTAQALVKDDGCPPNECGSNSSVIDGVHFYELSTSLGIPNSEGVTVTGYFGLPAGTTRLDVYNNELVARNANGTVVRRGSQLLYSGFELEVNGKVTYLWVTAFHRTLNYWAKPAPPGALHSYRFDYIVEGSGISTPRPLCTVTALADGEAALDAFVFEGDRYDPTTKQISTGAATKGWFNIAFMGGAPAKTHRMRATTASSDLANGVTSTLAQRQALFNMWTGNYCGDGTSFTVPGEPLRVRDAKNWIAHTSAWSWQDDNKVASYEAVWNADGAVCLDVPRRDDDAPGYRDVIAEHCANVDHPLPQCSQLKAFPDNWQDRGWYFTANPFEFAVIP